MLTRRKKQNLFYLFLGILIGVAASSIVVSFQVIKRFTQENLARIHNLHSRDTVEVLAYRNVPSSYALKENAADTLACDSLPAEDSTALHAEEEVILSDVRIASMQLSVPVYFTDTSREEEYRPLQVEQWENPMHFLGYRRNGRLLQVYGMNIDEMDFFYREKQLFVRCGRQEMALKETDAFVRFPHAFLYPLQVEN